MCKSTFYRKMQSQNGQKTFIFLHIHRMHVWYKKKVHTKIFDTYFASIKLENIRVLFEAIC